MAQLIVSGKRTSDFKPLDPGVYVGVCYLIAWIGSHENRWGNPQEKIVFGWEIPGETVKTQDGELPTTVHAIYTNSLSPRGNLYKMLSAWRGKAFTEQELLGFDVGVCLGRPALITIDTVTRGDKTYTNVVALSGVPAGMEVPEPTHEIIVTPDDVQQLADCPQWIQDKYHARLREESPGLNVAKELDREPVHPEDLNDDVPF